MTQGRPGRVKLFYKRQAGKKGVGRRTYPGKGAALLQSPTVPFFGTDEGSLPRGRAAISFYQLSLGLIHS